MTEREAYGLPADDRLPPNWCLLIWIVLSVLAWPALIAVIVGLGFILTSLLRAFS